MKTSIKLIASALLLTISLSVSSFGKGQDDHLTKAFVAAMFPANNTSKLWLCLEKYKPEEKVTLEVVNEKGQVMFQEIVSGKSRKKSAIRQQFDMSEIPDGTYTFRVSAESQKEEFTFKLATPNLEVNQPIRLVAIK
ncbi:flagellar hook assembly protein FlgD [Spirosoma endophyticum]|uniref:Por secretion system C-terminal sorting domain-containing protein n=1 Tax=Spirosoma endophyticum TaxID=662367 RepID=A0A1I1RHL2_9BACT|nr:hypothetical protein [Spirosoma endophyticum]SFD33815.1 hypothetical protein SAMN05216167_104414 [Spirosoma endophyticum]